MNGVQGGAGANGFSVNGISASGIVEGLGEGNSNSNFLAYLWIICNQGNPVTSLQEVDSGRFVMPKRSPLVSG